MVSFREDRGQIAFLRKPKIPKKHAESKPKKAAKKRKTSESVKVQQATLLQFASQSQNSINQFRVTRRVGDVLVVGVGYGVVWWCRIGFGWAVRFGKVEWLKMTLQSSNIAIEETTKYSMPACMHAFHGIALRDETRENEVL